MNKKNYSTKYFKSPGTYLMSKIDLGKIVEIQISVYTMHCRNKKSRLG
jgi:hypothetical protein